MLKMTAEITKEQLFKIARFVRNNLNTIVWLSTIILPYVMYYIGQYVYADRGRMAMGGEALIPLVIYIIASYIREYANKIGKGYDVPVPRKRFTKVDDGAVEIEHKRLHELILYVNDLEDWLEKRGMM